MQNLAPRLAPVKTSRVLFSPATARRLANPAFGHGVIPTRAATDREYAAFLAETTFSAEEMTFARRFNLDLAEARALLAEGAEALADLEWARLASLDDVNQAEAECDEDAMLAAMARRHDLYAEADEPSFAADLLDAVGPDPIAPPLAYSDTDAPPAEWCDALRTAIGTDLGPDAPVSLAEYLAGCAAMGIAPLPSAPPPTRKARRTDAAKARRRAARLARS